MHAPVCLRQSHYVVEAGGLDLPEEFLPVRAGEGEHLSHRHRLAAAGSEVVSGLAVQRVQPEFQFKAVNFHGKYPFHSMRNEEFPPERVLVRFKPLAAGGTSIPDS